MNKQQINVLCAIYSATDCSNGVFDYASLHWTRAKIADAMPELVESCDGVTTVDGDGFTAWDSKGRERVGRGFRLTNAGYEALTAHDAARYPADREHRRFWNEPTNPHPAPPASGAAVGAIDAGG